MRWYLNTLKTLIESPYHKMTRAKVNGKNIGTRLIPPVTFEHDMREGFPLLTTKFVPLRLVASELQWFLSGSTRKEDLHKMNNHIWDEWHLGDDENELGRVYGAQWTNWQTCDPGIGGPVMGGINQVQNIIDQLKKDPTNRRMICLAWNPGELDQMALPTCHVMWQINYYGDNLIGLHWTQRSCDFMLGVPFNIASYALLLLLICKHTGFKPGPLSGSLIDCHIYDNHIDAANTQLKRVPGMPPEIEILNTEENLGNFDIFKWDHTHIKFTTRYVHDPKIPMDVAT